MNARICLMIAALLVLVCWGSGASAGIILSDDFESYGNATDVWQSSTDNDPAGWTIDESDQTRVQVQQSPMTGNGGAYVIDTPYGSQFLQLWRDGSGSCTAYKELTSSQQSEIAAAGKMRVEIDVHNISGHDGWAGALGIHGFDSAPGVYANRAFSLSLRPTGEAWPYTGATVKNTALDAVFDCNTWERLTIDVDFTTDRWSVALDGMTVGELAFAGGDLSKIQTIAIGVNDVSGAAGRAGIDNLVVSAIPEPSITTLVATSLIGLLAYAWRRRK